MCELEKSMILYHIEFSPHNYTIMWSSEEAKHLAQIQLMISWSASSYQTPTICDAFCSCGILSFSALAVSQSTFAQFYSMWYFMVCVCECVEIRPHEKRSSSSIWFCFQLVCVMSRKTNSFKGKFFITEMRIYYDLRRWKCCMQLWKSALMQFGSTVVNLQ